MLVGRKKCATQLLAPRRSPRIDGAIGAAEGPFFQRLRSKLHCFMRSCSFKLFVALGAVGRGAQRQPDSTTGLRGP